MVKICRTFLENICRVSISSGIKGPFPLLLILKSLDISSQSTYKLAVSHLLPLFHQIPLNNCPSQFPVFPNYLSSQFLACFSIDHFKIRNYSMCGRKQRYISNFQVIHLFAKGFVLQYFGKRNDFSKV